MQTLDAPVYEIKKDSRWYQDKLKEEKDIEDFYKKINTDYFKDEGFAFYHESMFGVKSKSKDYETYKKELRKNPDKNGIHLFKKNAPHYKIFHQLLNNVALLSPFYVHDVLGLNNGAGRHWVGDRWFCSVKRTDAIKRKEELEPVEYKDYLQAVMNQLEEPREEQAQ